MQKEVVILAAGGTGGHLFPAQALAEKLNERGFDVHLATDRRANIFVRGFASDHVHVLQSATIHSKNPLAVIKALWQLMQGVSQSRALYWRLKPSLVVGFGGYPSLPPLYAACRAHITTMIHEQNAVMGRANKVLARRVNAIACGMPIDSQHYQNKMVVTGNPVRQVILDAASTAYSPSAGSSPFHLLVFGGSQGAKFFTDIMPKALALLPQEKRDRINLVQQVRDDCEDVSRQYKRLNIKANISSFFDDMALKIAQSNFIIARSGASTVAEIAAIGRPALFVPYPNALDHDQAANAAQLAATSGAIVRDQDALTPQLLADILMSTMDSPDLLATQAALVKQAGKRNATELLADLAEMLIKGKTVQDFKELHL